jgi:exosortase/archaeosortase family protein
MPSKKKKNVSSSGQRKYTTREIMEITEQRRPKRETVSKDAEPEAKTPENEPAPQIVEEVKAPDPKPAVLRLKEENVKEIKSKPAIPSIALIRSLAFILSLIALLSIVSSKFSESWVIIAVIKLNELVVNGSFLVLKIIQGSCTLKGDVLITPYYKVALQGDWVAFYSLELLVIFAGLFIFFQKMSRINKWVIFITLVSLAIVANIFRVVMACGLALNYGPASADRYFHGLLAGFVFIFIILGLIILEYLSSTE